MTDTELIALAAMAQAESVHHQVEALIQSANKDHIIPYGGPYGYDPATQRLWDELQKRGLMP